MPFCIQCGAKAPNSAKFCPQCGTAILAIEDVTDSKAKAPAQENKSKASTQASGSESVSIKKEKGIDNAATAKLTVEPDNDAKTTSVTSITEAGILIEANEKSKMGPWIGVGLIALLLMGSGAYFAGLFKPNIPETIPAPSVILDENLDPAATANKTNVISSTPKVDSEIEFYSAAIKSGRISDLGEFAANYAESTRAMDAQLAALDSLKRQNTVLAFETFTRYFPNADTSSYNGPKVKSDIPVQDLTTQDTVSQLNREEEISLDIQTPSEAESGVTPEPSATDSFQLSPIRPSIENRIEDLSTFISQGNFDYSLSVIDEMLALPDLSPEEATYLLNIRSDTESSRDLIVLEPESSSVEPVDQMPEIDTTAATEPPSPENPFDTPASPVERFGAVTPDAATEPGECDVTFSVAPSGTPVNIVSVCTDPIFITPATETVSEWVYSPALKNGDPVQQDGLVVKIRFHLDDLSTP